MNQEREMFCGMGAFQLQIFGFGCGSTLLLKLVLFGNFSHHPEWNLCNCKMALEPLTYHHTRDHVNVLVSGKSQHRAPCPGPLPYLPACVSTTPGPKSSPS